MERDRYQAESTAFITSQVAQWERERFDIKDPDETEDEGDAEVEAENAGDGEFGMQGVMQSMRVPII